MRIRLFVVLVIFYVIPSSGYSQFDREQPSEDKATEHLANIGAELYVERGTQIFTCVYLPERTACDADMAFLSAFPFLRQVHGSSSPGITDDGIIHLRKLNHLEVLELAKSSITDKGLRAIGGLLSLKHLDISDTKVSDEGVQSLLALRGIKYLDISRTRISDAGAVELAKLKRLEVLNADETDIGDEGVHRIAENCKRLRILSLNRTKVTGNSLASIKMLAGLEKLELAGNSNIDDEDVWNIDDLGNLWLLDLSNTNVTTAGISRLSGHKNLEFLFLTGTAVDDDVIPVLASLPSLRSVYLRNTRVTEEAKKELRRLCPGSTIL